MVEHRGAFAAWALGARRRGPRCLGAALHKKNAAHQPPARPRFPAQQSCKPPAAASWVPDATIRTAERRRYRAAAPLSSATRLLRLRPAPFGRPLVPRLAGVPAAPLCYSASGSPASARGRQDPLVARAWQDPLVPDRQDPRGRPSRPHGPPAACCGIFLSLIFQSWRPINRYLRRWLSSIKFRQADLLHSWTQLWLWYQNHSVFSWIWAPATSKRCRFWSCP